MNKLQNGFALIETLLIILILVVISLGGYYIWNSQKNTDKSLDNAEKSSQSMAGATSLQAKQAQLVLKSSKLKFDYNPAKWSIAQNSSGTNPQCGPFDNAQMDLKSKDYQLGFNFGECGKGGGDCQFAGACKVKSKLINVVKLSSMETAYIVVVQTISNTDSPNDYLLWLTDDEDCSGVICGLTPPGFNDIGLVSGSFTNNQGNPPADPGGLEQFVDLPQVKEAIAVLRTAHY